MIGDPAGFILSNSHLRHEQFVPEIKLHLARPGSFRQTDEELAEVGIPPPEWAYARAGPQALARYVLDHPETVRGRRVLDFVAGSGIVAIAAAQAGAARVEAYHACPVCRAAIGLNAAVNGVSVEPVAEPIIGTDRGWDTVLVASDPTEATHAETGAWMAGLRARGATILIAKPGSILPAREDEPLATYRIRPGRSPNDPLGTTTRVLRF